MMPKRMPLHSHAKAMICMSLLNSSTSMGTSLSLIRKISKTELSVFFDLECLSTLTHRKWPSSCQCMCRSATLNRFFCRSSARVGISMSTTLAGWFWCSGTHSAM